MQQRYPNPHNFPPVEALQAMSARDIGLMLLPVIVRTQQRPFVPSELVRSLCDEYAERNRGCGALMFEGIGYLERVGYLSEGMTRSVPLRMVMVTRAGRASLETGALPGAHAARALQAVDLLHPVIVGEALPEVDRGPDHFSTAILRAYRAIEIAVRDVGGFGGDRIGVPLMNAAFGPGGKLREESSDGGEAEAVRQLFAGAVGAFKNPVSHRDVEERDPAKVLRLLAFASALLEIVDERRRALGSHL
jgi:uncharacterized protein (TIGR02391 family)